jgi:hypothetical protein
LAVMMESILCLRDTLFVMVFPLEQRWGGRSAYHRQIMS